MTDEEKLIADHEGEGEKHDPEVQVTTASVTSACKLLVFPGIVTFMYFFALWIQYPIVQFWLFDHFSKKYNLVKGNESSVCTNISQANSSNAALEKQVQSETDNYSMYNSFMSNSVAIFSTIFIGPLTDRFGRKFVFYVSFVGLLANELTGLLIFQYNLMPELLFIGSFFQGLSGNYVLFMTAVLGMVADVTTPGKQRAFVVVVMDGIIALAYSAGSAASGTWVKEMGYIWPVATCMGVVVLATVITIFLIQETWTERDQNSFSCRIFLKSLEFYVKDTLSKRRLKLIICLSCFLIIDGAMIGESNFRLLFLMHQPLCWSKPKASIFNGVLTVLRWISVLLFILLGKRWISEPVFAIVGAVSCAGGYMLRGLSRTDPMVFIGAAVGLLMDTSMPMCKAMMSKFVLPTEQGALFAGIGILQMLVSAAGDVTMPNIYNVGLKINAGLPYFVLSGLVSIPIFLFIVLIIYMRRHPQVPEPDSGAENSAIVN